MTTRQERLLAAADAREIAAMRAAAAREERRAQYEADLARWAAAREAKRARWEATLAARAAAKEAKRSLVSVRLRFLPAQVPAWREYLERKGLAFSASVDGRTGIFSFKVQVPMADLETVQAEARRLQS